MYRLILFTIAIGLLIAFLYVLHVWRAAETRASKDGPTDGRTPRRLTLLCRIVAAGLCVCLFLMLAMTLMVLGQEFLFLRWASVGISLSRPAAHTPYFILMFELGGLSIMHLALFLLICSALKDMTYTANSKHLKDNKVRKCKGDTK